MGMYDTNSIIALVNAGDKEDAAQDVLSTLEEYAGMVDANCLCFLWLREFSPSRVCLISGSDARPVFSVFCIKGVEQDSLRDVIIHCDGSHFTLLRPITPPGTQGGCFKVTPVKC